MIEITQQKLMFRKQNTLEQIHFETKSTKLKRQKLFNFLFYTFFMCQCATILQIYHTHLL